MSTSCDAEADADFAVQSVTGRKHSGRCIVAEEQEEPRALARDVTCQTAQTDRYSLFDAAAPARRRIH